MYFIYVLFFLKALVVFADDSYVLFVTTQTYEGNLVGDAACATQATADGLANPTNAKALISGNVASWNDTYNLYGIGGIFVSTASNFRTGTSQTLSVDQFDTRCQSGFWTGFADSTGFTSGQNCLGWTDGNAELGTRSLCSQLPWNNVIQAEYCQNYEQVLCYYPITYASFVFTPTQAPTPPTGAPSTAPIVSFNPGAYDSYVMYLSDDYVSGYGVDDAHCITAAETAGYANSIYAKGLFFGNTLNWQDSYNLYGPSGVFISNGYNFRTGDAPFAATLQDANVKGVGATYYNTIFWAGFGSTNFTAGPNGDCSGWTTNAGYADVGDVQYLSFPGGGGTYRQCGSQYLTLCYMPIVHDTFFPLVYQYTVFVTANTYYADSLVPDNCVAEARTFGYSNPQVARPLAASFVSGWNDSFDVVSWNGALISSAYVFRTGDGAQFQSFDSAGVVCPTGSIFHGFTTTDFTGGDTCLDWTSSSATDSNTYSDSTFCTNPYWKQSVSTEDCSIVQYFLCYMDSTAQAGSLITTAPTTLQPTTLQPTNLPTTQSPSLPTTAPTMPFVLNQQGQPIGVAGKSVDISADGNTFATLVSGFPGLVNVYIRMGNDWSIEASGIACSNITSATYAIGQVAVSANGNTLVISYPFDSNNTGALCVFVRSAGIWTQYGNKLTGTDTTNSSRFGSVFALSGDGSSIVAGAPDDNSLNGAAWMFLNENGIWTQQGAKLVVQGPTYSMFGSSCALSYDGNTTVIGGKADNNYISAIWTFKRINGVWTQQGNKLVGTGYNNFGTAVDLSYDAMTMVIGDAQNTGGLGAFWVFDYSNGVWSTQGKMVCNGSVGSSAQGSSVSISGNGEIIAIGGEANNNNEGVTWLFYRSGDSWIPLGDKLLGTGSTGSQKQGHSVSLSSNGETLVVAGSSSNFVWVFAYMTSSPSVAPTVSPTLQPSFTPNAYRVFITDALFAGNQVNDANCQSEAATQGLQYPNTARALIAENVGGWDDSISVFGPTGVFLGTGYQFRRADPIASFNDTTMPLCISNYPYWTGMGHYDFNATQTCNGWTTNSPDVYGGVGYCGGYWKENIGVFNCENTCRIVCFMQLRVATSMPTTLSPTTGKPSASPTTSLPSASPIINPTSSPTRTPSRSPLTSQPTGSPTTSRPSASPNIKPTASPTPPTKNPTPAGIRYIVFATQTGYAGDQVKDENCVSTAIALGISGATSPKALIAGNMDLWSYGYGVYGPTGLYLGTSNEFENANLPNTLASAGICTGYVTTGFDSYGFKYHNGGNDCDMWSTVNDYMTSSSCDTSWGYTTSNRVPCTYQYAHLCWMIGSSNSPSQAPAPPTPPTTLRPTSRSPSTTPTQLWNSIPMVYVVFATTGKYPGNQVNDTGCGGGGAKALVAHNMQGWNTSLDVYGPTGLFIASGLDFMTGASQARSLLDANVGCTDNALWSGFASDSFGWYYGYECGSWTIKDNTGATADCSNSVNWKMYQNLNYCDQMHQFLCYKIRTTTHAPTPAPTNPRYTLFLTTNSFVAGEVNNQQCVDEAARLGLSTSAFSMIGGNTLLARWNPTYDVYGPTGIYMSSASDFVNLKNTDISISQSLRSAGMNCEEIWAGFAFDNGFFARNSSSCSFWDPNSVGYTATTIDCYSYRWMYPWRSYSDGFTGYRTCDTQLKILCASSSTGLPPTSPARRYTVFSTVSKYTADQVNDQHCKDAAASFSFTGDAWALIAGSPRLAFWDNENDVYSPTGVFIATGADFATTNGAQTYTGSLVATGVGCVEVWRGFTYGSANVFDSNSGSSCSGWSTNSDTSYGTSQTCDANTWNNALISRPCSTSLQIMCVIEDVITRSPTTSHPSLSPVPAPSKAPTQSTRSPVTDSRNYVVFATTDMYRGGYGIVGTDKPCVDRATQLNLKYPYMAQAFTSGNIPTWDGSLDVTGPTGIFIAKARDFAIGLPQAVPLVNAQVGCTGYVWTGTPSWTSAAYFQSPDLTCNEWKQQSGTGLVGDCSASSYNALSRTFSCDQYFQYLCYAVNASDETVPFPGATHGVYTIYATSNTYYGYEVNDQHCIDDARAMALDNPETAYALVSNSRKLKNWEPMRNVQSITRVFLTGALNFKKQTYPMASTFQDAGVGCTNDVWAGFYHGTFDTFVDCGAWTNPSDQALTGRCYEKQFWVDDLRQSASTVSCQTLKRPYLCVYDFDVPLVPSKAPTTRSPTLSSSPTASASPTIYGYRDYIVFSTRLTYKATEIRDSNCQQRAQEMQFVNASTAHAYYYGAPNLTDWDYNVQVLGPTGIYIAESRNFFWIPVTAYYRVPPFNFKNALVGCGDTNKDSVWAGYPTPSAPISYNCDNWTQSYGYATVAACSEFDFNEQYNGAQPCSSSRVHLCVIRSAFPPTPAPTTLSPFSAVPTQLPTASPTIPNCVIYQTSQAYTANNVKDSNCPVGKALTSVTVDSWHDNRPVYSQSGMFITTGANFRTRTSAFDHTLVQAGVCSGRLWTGFTAGSFLSDRTCSNWTTASTTRLGVAGSCAGQLEWGSASVVPCSVALPHLCYFYPNATTTGPPTSVPPSPAPTTASPTLSYGYYVYRTNSYTYGSLYYPGYYYKGVYYPKWWGGDYDYNKDCHNIGLSYGFSNGMQLASYDFSTWDMNTFVYGPSGIRIAPSSDFIYQNRPFERTLNDAGINCADNDIWTGMIATPGHLPVKNSCDAPTYQQLTCDSLNAWSAYRTGARSCIILRLGFCVARAPRPSAPRIPDRRYVVYTTPNKYKAYEVRDSNCPFPGSWAFTAYAPELASWNDNLPVYGSTGLYITDAANFRDNINPFDRTLVDAGVICSQIWTGFVSGFTPGWGACSKWEVDASIASTQFTSFGTCDDITGWAYAGTSGCDDTMQHLCIMEDGFLNPTGAPATLPPGVPQNQQTSYPTRLPTTRYPTVAPTPPPVASKYTLFLTDQTYAGNQVSDVNCRNKAFALGYTEPATAWTYVKHAPRLATLTPGVPVVTQSGVVIGDSTNLANFALTSTLLSGGLSCNDIWTGFTPPLSLVPVTVCWSFYICEKVMPTELDRSCNGWTLPLPGDTTFTANFLGTTSSCSKTNFLDVTEVTCKTSHKQLCVYEKPTPAPTQAPTPNPTVLCPELPSIRSSYSFVYDECIHGFIFDTVRPGASPIELPLEVVCLNRTLSVDSRVINGIGANPLPYFDQQSVQWGSPCKSMEIWLGFNQTVPLGISYMIVDSDEWRVTFLNSAFRLGSLVLPVTYAASTPYQLFVQKNLTDATLCMGVASPLNLTCISGAYGNARGTTGIATNLTEFYATTTFQDCQTQPNVLHSLKIIPFLGVTELFVFGSGRVSYGAE